MGFAKGLPNWAALKDFKRREAFAANETLRQALKYLTQNTTLDYRTRVAAMHKLAAMPAYTRPTEIRNRCILTGRGRGQIASKEFGLSRHRFKLAAERGELPGVERASW
ncbi:mitochondrial 40S ribosomal protein MRP2 [Rhodotorula toruloides]|uniref:Mitochondrial 40S ribosomal protein MRP2 n=1 Tax=Rhodotorula toruloides TaxID=5286 RepID=A0A511KPL8_RHOTO|nr:mitochondrial 40S ribosomal protein MRP2 [Rhodotorula toruloides]